MSSCRTLRFVNYSPESTSILAGNSFFQPLLSGERGTAQTVALAKKLVDRAVKDPYVNRCAIEIVRHTPQYDDLAKIHAIYNWVSENITYVQDPIGPFGAKETLRPARDLLALCAGDCDDINGVLFPSLLGTIGYSTRVVTIAGDPENPREFTHIYCEVLHDGEWIPLDAARPGARFGEEPPFYYRKKIWPMTDEGFSLLGGGRGLAGYMGRLGDGVTAADIQAAGAAAAQVISAANQNPYSYQYFSNSPLAATAAPGLMAQQLGYGSSASIFTTGNLTPWIIGGGLLLLYLASRK